MATDPAFEISLTDSEKIALGELCVIQGQIEHLLDFIIVVIASRNVPLGASFTTDRQEKRHGTLGVSVKEWIAQICHAAIDPNILRACEIIYRDIANLCEDRNDFVHATYGAWIDIASQPHTVVPISLEARTQLASQSKAQQQNELGRI